MRDNNGYWWMNYGRFEQRSKDFIDGVVAGIEAFAVWDNGLQVVGVLKRPLEEVIREVHEELDPRSGL